MLRQAILLASRSRALRTVIERAPVSGAVVRRFVAGTGTDAAVATAEQLAATGLCATLDLLGEDTTDRAAATAVVTAYQALLGRLGDAGLTSRAEVSVKLTAVGLDIDPALGRDNAAAICAAARAVGTTVTVDMEDSARTQATLDAVLALRSDFPDTGAVLQAYLHRTADDAAALAGPGSRVRLCKGAYNEPATVAFQSRAEVSAAYARCLQTLMDGQGRPLVATHDPALIALADRLATERQRPAGSYEYQMLLGIRTEEQQRLAAAGHTVRVYVPYGAQWYGYLMRRLAEKPANLAFFARALVSRS